MSGPCTDLFLATDDRPLEAVAADINRAHAEAQEYAGKAVERALAAGDLLLTVKARLNHGDFGSWCKTHCPDISVRTLQDYMRVARELPIEKRSAAHLSLREALRLVAGEPEPLLLTVEPTPPWWETQTPELNNAFCADWDMLEMACAWMDTAGVSFGDIATRLDVSLDAVTRAIDPQIPNDLHLGAGQEADAGMTADLQSLWNRCKRLAERSLIWRIELAYRNGAEYAHRCNNPDMATRLAGIAGMQRNRYARIQKEDDPLIQSLSLRLATAAVSIDAPLLPAFWMEVGMAALALDSKKPQMVDIYRRATMVWAHCADTMDVSKLIDKPLHLAEISRCTNGMETAP